MGPEDLDCVGKGKRQSNGKMLTLKMDGSKRPDVVAYSQHKQLEAPCETHKHLDLSSWIPYDLLFDFAFGMCAKHDICPICCSSTTIGHVHSIFCILCTRAVLKFSPVIIVS